MTIAEFDHLGQERMKELLFKCCGSTKWVDKMLTALPMEDLVQLLETVEEKWNECQEEDWKEAFSHHPQIGDIDSLKHKFANTAGWAVKEQAGVNHADDKILLELKDLNQDYLDRFGFIFIVCATGLSADEMLTRLKERMDNSLEGEVKTAAAEQLQITKLRIEKLFDIN